MIGVDFVYRTQTITRDGSTVWCPQGAWVQSRKFEFQSKVGVRGLLLLLLRSSAAESVYETSTHPEIFADHEVSTQGIYGASMAPTAVWLRAIPL